MKNVRLTQPLDSDKDGIDDVYELNRATFLNPLDPADAPRDQDTDGFTNLAEYQKGTDPAVGDAPSQSQGLYPGVIVSLSSGSYLRAGDFNNDGRTDLVTLSDVFEASLQVSLANPDGTFQASVASLVSGSQGLQDVLLAKVDSDDRLDLVLMDTVTRAAFVMRGLGNGKFEKLAQLDTGGIPTSVALGDVNGDGRLDFVITLKDFKVSIHLSQSSGGWQAVTPVTLSSVPTHAVLGQYNSDNQSDLAVTLSSGQVAVLLGNGNGSFGAPQMFRVGLSPERLTAGDINGDGKTDLITANKSTDDISLLLGNGDGTFAPEKRHPVGDNPHGLHIEDLNGDNRLDLLVSHFGADFHSALLNQGNGSFAPQKPIYTASKLRLLAGQGQGIFTDTGTIALESAPTDVLAGDIDGDGKPDLVVASALSGKLIPFTNAGDGRYQSGNAVTVGEYVSHLLVQDLDQDGRAEILVAGHKNQGRQFFLNLLARGPDGSWTERQAVTLTNEISALAWADVTGDGKPEILVATSDPLSGAAKVELYPVAGGKLSSQQPLISLDRYIADVAVGDANVDGRIDLYVPQGVFLANPTGGFSELQPFWIANAASPKVIDLNGDSRPDLVGLADRAIIILLHE